MSSLCDDVNGVAQQVGLGDIGRPEPQQRLDEVDVAHESNKQLALSPPQKNFAAVVLGHAVLFFCSFLVPVVFRINTDCRDFLLPLTIGAHKRG